MAFKWQKKFVLKVEAFPILFLTACPTKDDTLEGFKVGADDYMTKPFSMEELVQESRRSFVGRPFFLRREKKSPSFKLACTRSTTRPNL